ncbi:hypothetical protein AK812_SmicGene11379 [Symbiodinium microadriaticum]|uniref:Uncharacterized protein n=1 Tax=Symbiodinium microadriaticum TaxID=2951 RepID=A0A1Q9EDG8_SYMMI|nr:hypothetical protein AK812_SmicGene11379 [Symbiodinium microadriaticum]
MSFAGAAGMAMLKQNNHMNRVKRARLRLAPHHLFRTRAHKRLSCLPRLLRLRLQPRKRRGDLRRITTTSNDNDDAFGEIEEEFSPKTDIGVVGAVSIVIPEHMAHGAISLPSLREHLQLRTGSDLSNHKADIRHFAEMEVEAIRLAATPAAVDRGRCPYRTLTDLCECDQTQTSDVDASLTSLYGHCTVGPVHVQWPIWECMLPPRAWANVISAAA